MEITHEQRALIYALCNIINLGIIASLGCILLCDWIEDRFIEPWKERIRRRAEGDQSS